ncbi:MAG: mercuric reductase [Acidobacteriota bacterium]|nr:MAG: mercuric reductase [Acidobacteriota bacterium]
MQENKYDAVVIGSGQGGKPLALALAGAGWKTAVIERAHVGGTCVNVGCTPTKTMVASARAAWLARRASDYGVKAGDVTVDLAEVRRRKQGVVEDFRNGGRNALEKAENLELIFAEAAFTGPDSIILNGAGERELKAGKIFINTGCRPARPSIEGLDRIDVLDSSSIMELDAAPGHLIIIGGGYIGLEFGQMFRRFGSKVTVVQRGGQLLGREDQDVADAVLEIMLEDGIDVLLDSTPVRVDREGSGAIRLAVRTPEGKKTVQGTHLLTAAGRVPNTEALDLKAAGVETDRHGFIRTNERLETNVTGIYALGDVKGGPQFTHISYDDFRIIRSNLLDGANKTVTGRYVPYTVYIDPQLGRVGMSESEAREQGIEVRIASMPMAWVARAIEMGETRGFMKAVIDAKTDRILGCAVLGVEGGEIMSMIQIAMMGGLTYTVLRDGTFAHPALAESLNNLFNNIQVRAAP